jgi:transcriptional regulator with XRE-family HTH domain
MTGSAHSGSPGNGSAASAAAVSGPLGRTIRLDAASAGEASGANGRQRPTNRLNGRASSGQADRAPANGSSSDISRQIMHRISTVRQRQGVSLRSAARQMRIDVRRLRSQEDESSDILLSTLYKWQQVLDVPISELLVDANDPVSSPILERARMLKIMKTVAAIRDRAESKPIKRMAEMLCDQLIEIMPELKDVTPWHSVGQRRTSEEYGRIVERRLPDDFFLE